ncbi:MAG TPA: four helix bundle protein, partial [Ignavibacteria bacterium]|nr:four helix bundle protein [Ignavibacteria bacterium]
MRENILKTKSFAFALKVIQTYKEIVKQYKEYVLSKQFLKAGTSIGALVREAEFAQSKADFISKLSISLKESNETEYWILLLQKSDYITPNISKELLSDNRELT